MSGCSPCNFQDTSYLGDVCGASFALFMGIVDHVIRAQCDIADPCGRLGKSDLFLDGSWFDFVVVGAGVAGPVVASRLSENPDWNVLLLEAGPEEPTTTEIPAFAVTAKGTALDWNYTTVSQSHACLNTGGICKWPRGKMVSGTGSMHGMMYTRGHRSIYDNWAALGNDGWAYEDILPYFIKAEKNQNRDEVDEGYHGYDGPLTVQQFPYHPALAEAVVEGGVELGYRQGDLNGANQTGINIAQMMVHEGLRASTPRMYLRPHRGRPNLYVAIHSHVTKVVIENAAAVGVEFLDKRDGKQTVYASKEVILSAGTIGSPQLLLLSGVGPSQDLARLGIPVISDLPVGKNLQNHVSMGIEFFLNDTDHESLTLESLNQFLKHRNGPMSATGLTQTTAFLLSKYTTDVPDVQIFFDGYLAKCSRTGLRDECGDGNVSACGRRRVYGRPTNIHPASVGTLTLKSADPLQHPLLDPNYLSEERDVEVLVDAARLLINLTATRALQAWGFELDTTPVPGCGNLTFGSDAYWGCVARRATGPENHQCGTCKMGPVGHPEAVVDPQLRVQGVFGLRVADASVFPFIPNSNPVATIIMVAEKLSDMVKQTWDPVYPQFQGEPPRKIKVNRK